MAKRYHQSMKDRRHESEGMMNRDGGESKMAMRRNGGMINDDMSAPALLPRHVIDQYWDKAPHYGMEYVPDLFEGVQKQMHEDYEDMRREAKPGKY